MSRKDYELIARTIKMLYGDLAKADRDLVANRFAEALVGTNPLFNRKRFLAACGTEG